MKVLSSWAGGERGVDRGGSSVPGLSQLLCLKERLQRHAVGLLAGAVQG